VIVYPDTPEQWKLLGLFLLNAAHVQPSADMKLMAWAEDNKVRLVVGFNAFMGRVCQMHVAMEPNYHFTPKEMLRVTFDHAFNSFKVKKLIGILNSKNEKAMKYDLHLGFTEEYRMPGMHDDGGDIVILSMTREQCKYLDKEEAAA
jgi:hypothetical protein